MEAKEEEEEEEEEEEVEDRGRPDACVHGGRARGCFFLVFQFFCDVKP